MPDFRSIPDDTKWRIATQCSTRLVMLSDKIFRPALPDRYDELEQEIWIDMARFAYEIALSLRFPVETPRDLAESLRSVNMVFFGPDFKEEVIETDKDNAVLIIRRCPRIAACDNASSGEGMFHRCMAFTLASQKAMNPSCSSRFVRAMCMGDRQCEIKIGPEKAPAKQPAGKMP